jgi:cytochrome P450
MIFFVTTETQQTSSIPNFPFIRPEPFGMPGQYEGLRATESVPQVRSADGKLAWLITRYEDVRSVLMDERLSTDKNNPGYPLQNRFFGTGKVDEEKTFFDMDNPDHGVFRRMFATEFTSKAVRNIVPRIQAIVDERLDRMAAAGGPQDLNTSLSLALPTRALCLIIGVPYADFDRLQEKTDLLVSLSTPPAEAAQASAELRDYFLELIAAKRLSPDDDLISRCIRNFVDAGQLSEVQLASTCRILLVAGFETTASMITLGTLALLEHPDQLALFRTMDDQHVGRAIEELLRYLAVAHVGRRRVAIAELEIAGHTIVPGDGIIIATDAADSDSSVFTDPRRLDITRQGNPIVSFGYGVHQCIGQNLARAELRIALTTLFTRFPNLRLARPSSEVAFDQNAMAYRAVDLPVQW